MNDSILTSIKKLLGITEEYEDYDTDIIVHINSVFMILNQLGVGPEDVYMISSKENMWSEFTKDRHDIESVKTYMFAKVKLIFDPPTSSALIDVYNRLISELEFRLNVAVDPPSEVKNTCTTTKE